MKDTKDLYNEYNESYDNNYGLPDAEALIKSYIRSKNNNIDDDELNKIVKNCFDTNYFLAIEAKTSADNIKSAINCTDKFANGAIERLEEIPNEFASITPMTAKNDVKSYKIELGMLQELLDLHKEDTYNKIISPANAWGFELSKSAVDVIDSLNAVEDLLKTANEELNKIPI